jgi:hypothetical protein
LISGYQNEVEFLTKLRALADQAEEEGWVVDDVLRLLRAIQPEDKAAKDFLVYISWTVSQRK